MSKLNDDLVRLINKLTDEREAREKRLANELIRIYREARKDLHIKFLQLTGREDSLEITRVEALMQELERNLKRYTQITVKARQDAIDESFLFSQELSGDMLKAGGVNPSVIVGFGQINREMIESLIGNLPKLAGKVEMDVLVKIRDELTRGAILGESIPKIASRVFGTGLTTEGLKKPMSLKQRSIVIARTEIIKASDAGYEDLAVKAQRVVGEEIYDAWLTARDERVAKPDRQLGEGTHSSYKSITGYPGVYNRVGGPRPVISTHPQCRCRRVPFLISWVKSGALDLTELRKKVA